MPVGSASAGISVWKSTPNARNFGTIGAAGTVNLGNGTSQGRNLFDTGPQARSTYMNQLERISWIRDCLIEMHAPTVSDIHADCGGKISKTTIRRLLPKAIDAAERTYVLGGTPKILVRREA